jgi:2,4-dienoyl-CoA reductase-like NADH-dependent reductase (Old Yellow Enzyme family)
MTKGLFDEVTFRCGAVAKNRVALAPLTNGQSHDDGTLGDDELTWLARRAAGGFGVVETCAAHVSPDGKGFDGQLGVFADAHLDGLTRLARAVSDQGALGVVQLYHGGVRCPSRLTGQQPWSASVFHENKPTFETPRAATDDDLTRVIGQFADAAVRCERAGFAGVELHGAHGYLLGQFLSRTMNTRDDAWGGAIEGRARLVREVTRSVRARVSKGFLVGVRLSPEDFGFTRGVDLDETVSVAHWLCEDGVDWIHLSLWDARRMTKKRPDVHPLALFREALPDAVKIVAAGGIWDRADADAALARGADLVAVGKAAVITPDWPVEARAEGYVSRRGPLTREEYAARAVSERFVGYLGHFDNMVAK